MYIKAKKRKRRTRNEHPAQELGVRVNSHLFHPWHGIFTCFTHGMEEVMVLNKGIKLCGQKGISFGSGWEFGILQTLKSLWKT